MRLHKLGGRGGASRWVAVSIGLLAARGGPAVADEIAPFRITGFDGYATMRYLSDSQSTEQPAATGTGSARLRSRQAQSDFRTDVFMTAHGYVYHPNLLSFDIGGGPVLQRQSVASNDQATATAGTMYNFSARANLLRGKPVNGSAYMEHLNPTLTVAPGDVITQESTRYGFDIGVTGALSPVPARLAMSSSHVTGRGSTRSIDDQIDQFTLNASRSHGALGSTQLQYQSTTQASASGSVDMPIQESRSSTQGIGIDTRLQFGDERQHDFTNLISANSRAYTVGQSSLPTQEDFNLLFDFRSRFTPAFSTFALSNTSSSTQGSQTARTQSLAGGMNYIFSPALEGALALRSENSDTSQFRLATRTLDGSLKHQQELLSGVLQAGYAFRYDRRTQEASAPTSNVQGEALVFSGISPSVLARARVVAGSVVVSNATRTQVFLENVDYQISLVGTETRLIRIAAGAILDGEQVLVDYAYDNGGTYALDQLDQTANLSWNLSRYLNVYYRQFESRPTLVSGTPTFQLNPVHSDLYGVRSELPFRLGAPMTFGFGVEREVRDEVISPFRREAGDAFIQTDDSFLGLGSYRLSARRLRVSYQNAAQDVNVTGYDLRSWSRKWFGIDLSMVTAYERDDGGLQPRRRMDNTFSAQWRERKFLMNLNFVTSRESQGDFQRDRQMLNLTVRRDF